MSFVIQHRAIESAVCGTIMSTIDQSVRMPRTTKRLSARFVETCSTPGDYPDGDNLYLRVSSSTSKQWVFRCKSEGRLIIRGIGSARMTSLAEARDSARSIKLQVKRGEITETKKASQQSLPTFRELAQDYISRHRTGWSDKHATQWQNTLRDYVYPVIGDSRVDQISIAEVKSILDPIWADKTETASRVRGRIEMVLDMARSMGHTMAGNPAAWRGNLQHHYPAKSRISPTKHHDSIGFARMPAVYRSLVEEGSQASLCVAMICLCGARLNEVASSERSEFDLKAKIWTLPVCKKRNKSKREHRVPLSDQVLDVIHRAQVFAGIDLLFPNSKGKALSDVALNKALKRHAEDISCTVHGLRTTFRTWAEEQSCASERAKEYSLAHYGERSEKLPYLKTDLLEERRVLMQEWGNYLETR